MLIAKTFRFDAAHQLQHHKGKCQRMHGHTYTVEVAITGPVQPPDGRSESGMVIDFGKLSDTWKQHVEPHLDHRTLNESLPTVYPTAEYLAEWIRNQFMVHLGDLDLVIEWVKLWETPDSYALATGRESV